MVKRVGIGVVVGSLMAFLVGCKGGLSDTLHHSPIAQAVSGLSRTVKNRLGLNDRWMDGRFTGVQQRQIANLNRVLKRQGGQVIHYGDRIWVVLEEDYYFEHHNTELKPDGLSVLNSIAEMIKRYPKAEIDIIGFTDDVGGSHWNQHYSEQLAKRIKSYLWARGINQDRMHTRGVGEKYPIADNRTVVGNYMNRHVEIRWRTRPHFEEDSMIS